MLRNIGHKMAFKSRVVATLSIKVLYSTPVPYTALLYSADSLAPLAQLAQLMGQLADCVWEIYNHVPNKSRSNITKYQECNQFRRFLRAIFMSVILEKRIKFDAVT